MSESIDVGNVLSGDENIIQSTYGPITTTVFGDRTRSPCIAYHEVGLNHRTCFRSLIVASGPNSLLLKNFFIIFIDAPGCQVTYSKDLFKTIRNHAINCPLYTNVIAGI